MATFTVIIPAYNAEKTIGFALASLEAQTRKPDQIVVVDDGSSDATAEIASTFSPAVTLIRQTNSGPAAARQNGGKAATGDYVLYLDADDWWPTDRLEQVEKIVAHESICFLLTDLERQNFDPVKLAPTGERLPPNSAFFPDAMRFLFEVAEATGYEHLLRLASADATELLLRGYPVYPSTAVVRRDVLEDVGGWDARFTRAEDFDLGLRIVRHYPLHYLHRVHAVLGLHDGNSDARKYTIKQTIWDIRVLEAHLAENCGDARYAILLRRALGLKHRGLAHFYRISGDLRSASQEYRRALSYPGGRIHAAVRWAATASRLFR